MAYPRRVALALDDTQAAAPADRTHTEVRGKPVLAGAGIPTGVQLGHFRIERPLGAGGMGEVYFATDLTLDRPVAIKVLPEQLARDPKRRERMIREARAQARVGHPNVAHIYFIGDHATGDDARLYFAMEYIAGRTLADHIAHGPMAIDAALAVIRDAALGLREAHRNGFTHRDVKPSNLMIDGHGVVKLLDFGLVATGDLGRAWIGPVEQTSLAGTPLYMAPEQARGEPVDFRADIYALGATLYHLIVGKPPFFADTLGELISLHATAARPAMPRRGQPRTRIGAIDNLCGKMMAQRVEDRFASYDDLLRAIELVSIAHTRPGGFWVRSLAMVLDFVLIVMLFGIAQGIAAAITHTPPMMGALIVPVLAVYQTIAVGRWGRTLGKALMELEVVDVETSRRPGLVRSTWRALAMFGFPVFATAIDWLGSAKSIAGFVALVTIVLGLGALLHAATHTSGKRTLWDRVARTMVRYRPTSAEPRRPA